MRHRHADQSRRALLHTATATILGCGAAATLSGCGIYLLDPALTPGRELGPTTNPETVKPALEFGGIVLPPSAVVLGVQVSVGGPDVIVAAVISLPQRDVPAMLTASGFTTPLTPGILLQPAIEGLSPTTRTDIASATDQLPYDGDPPWIVTRQLTLDTSDPSLSVAHLLISA